MSAPASATRGALWIPLAKVWFVLAGFVLHFGLPNLLDSAAVGDYGVVNRAISLVNMVMTTGALQAVSRYVAADPSRAAQVRRSALRLTGGLGLALGLLWSLAAPWIAAALRDDSLVPLLWLAAPIPLCYGVYAVYVGVLNGSRRFQAQAALDIGYATARVAAILGAAALGYGASGAIAGFAAAALAIALVAAGHGQRSTPASAGAFPVGELVRFAVPVLGFVLVANLALSADLFLVKRLAPEDVQKLWTGAYFAILNLGMVPYSLVVSINFIVFPLMSAATFAGDSLRAASYARASLRLALLLAAGIEATFAAAPRDVLALVYPSHPEWLPLAEVTVPLGLAYVALTLFHVVAAMLNAAGRPRLSLLLALGMVVVQVAAVTLLLPAFGLIGAAIGSAVAFVAGAAAANVAARAALGAALPLATLARAAVGVAAAFAVAAVVDLRGVAFVVEAALCFAAFVAAVLALGELDGGERAALRAAWARRLRRGGAGS